MIPQLYKTVSAFLNNVGIRKKLLSSYVILIILPLGLFSYVIYTKISGNFKQQVIFSESQSIKQTASILQYKIDQAVTATDAIVFNKDVQDILAMNNSAYDNDIEQQNIDGNKLENYLSSFQKNNIFRSRIYVRNGFTFSNENVNLFNIDLIKEEPWYAKVISSKDKVVWLPPENLRSPNTQLVSNVISTMRKIRNLNNFSDIIGIIRVDILEKNISDVIKNASISRNGIVSLENSDGHMITVNNVTEFQGLGLDTYFTGAKLQSLAESAPVTIKSTRFILNSVKISDTDWTLISLIPYEEIVSTGSQLRNYMLVLIAITIIIAYFFAYLISYSSVKRIGLLVNSMKQLEQGNFETRITVNGTDEIGKLMLKFNYMSKKMEEIVGEQFIAGQNMKIAELRTLQSQINPHFLYNTLDMINWAAMTHRVPEIEQTVRNLAKFYKLSLNKGRDVIPIADEIGHVQAYVDIQNQRFEDRIELKLDIDERIYSFSTLKIILQPIVENSILHGILEKEEKSGTIRITGRMENDTVILQVQDDGVGMKDDQFTSTMFDKVTADNHGYGLRNINERIKLYYGSQYGLTCQSIQGRGTLVEIRIPACHD